ncbi:MAG: UDP-N-acetylglucosamine 2-epimerase (non-hydrolyzing) [Candidatus Paceibacterota bacterium]
MKKKICFILGTRPEIIKMTPVIRECIKRKVSFFVLHTHQHYSENLDKVFFADLNLSFPKYNLQIGSGGHGEQTGKMIIEIEKILLKETPDIVLVQGDTNTVLAGALVAAKLYISIGHIEAGLRSFDRRMPEELNRIMVDHISDMLFAPTEESKNNLTQENIDTKRIFVVGNTVVDAVKQNIEIARTTSQILHTHNLRAGKYFLVTAHRQENVDDKERLQSLLGGLMLVAKKYNMPVIFPIHPRASKMIKHFGLHVDNTIQFVEPVGYLDFLQLSSNARMILTDSGGLQEEALILKVPCVTLRDNTERPETLIGGGNRIAGVSQRRILRCTQEIMDNTHPIKWGSPFGEGDTSQKILDIILKHI